jgi:hypothetical protein
MESSVFWDIMPCSPLKVNQLLRLPPDFTLVSYSTYTSTLKMEATRSSETSVYFQRTIRRYVAEDRTLNKMGVQETGLEAVNLIPLAMDKVQLLNLTKTVMTFRVS